MVSGERRRVLFHVTSVTNRDSIVAHGLDWRLMQHARGIAGSDAPEQEGCFLCQDESEAAWFAQVINNTGGAVDVWEVVGISESDLLESPEGYLYLPEPIAATQLRLLRTEQPGESV